MHSCLSTLGNSALRCCNHLHNRPLFPHVFQVDLTQGRLPYLNAASVRLTLFHTNIYIRHASLLQDKPYILPSALDTGPIPTGFFDDGHTVEAAPEQHEMVPVRAWPSRHISHQVCKAVQPQQSFHTGSKPVFPVAEANAIMFL
eukprot:GHUV01041483.1.p2 GENE.GHUV01041483.1~~GHUV01041483.1.p2  ORF type:complete len:144 (+),score=10.22 GHUV01041483.1:2-433(+)